MTSDSQSRSCSDTNRSTLTVRCDAPPTENRERGNSERAGVQYHCSFLQLAIDDQRNGDLLIAQMLILNIVGIEIAFWMLGCG